MGVGAAEWRVDPGSQRVDAARRGGGCFIRAIRGRLDTPHGHSRQEPHPPLTTMLNRSVLIVRPRQPMVDWVAGLDESGLASNVEGEQTAYLVPEFDDGDEAQQVLEDVFAEVFERELFGWRTDEATWPANRDLALFRQWFEIELHSVVEDLCDFELTDDED
jgi:hypothetical protein